MDGFGTIVGVPLVLGCFFGLGFGVVGFFFGLALGIVILAGVMTT